MPDFFSLACQFMVNVGPTVVTMNELEKVNIDYGKRGKVCVFVCVCVLEEREKGKVFGSVCHREEEGERVCVLHSVADFD